MSGRLAAARLPVLLALAGLLVSCAGLQRAADRGVVRDLERLLERGDSEELARRTQVPFLLDGEVVVLPEDVRGFWSGAVAAGYRLPGAELLAGEPSGEDTWRRFGGTFETQAFFTRYVEPGARVLELRAADGRAAMLLVRQRIVRDTILAWSTP